MKMEFIRKSKKKYPNKFDYSKVIYINSDTEVILGCKKHNLISIKPSNHLKSKYGCRKCGRENSCFSRRTSTKDVIKEFIKIHEKKYDYSKVKCNGAHTNVIVICPRNNHGEFEVTPSNHKAGKGCKKCAVEDRTKDLTNTKVGKLTVLRQATKEELTQKGVYGREAFWWMQCSCGREPFLMPRNDFTRKDRNQNIRACKICADRIRGLKVTEEHFNKIKDINFGLLKILRDWGCDEHSNRNLLCECKCGNRPIIRMTALTEGSTKSCGCISGVGEDQYFNFLNDASYADQGCHFYLADLDDDYVKPGISSVPKRRKRQNKYRSYEFLSPEISRAEAWTIEQIILKESERDTPKNTPEKFENMTGGKYEIRVRTHQNIGFYQNRFFELLEEMSSKGWQELFEEKFLIKQIEDYKHTIKHTRTTKSFSH